MRECWANMATARCCIGRARRPATYRWRKSLARWGRLSDADRSRIDTEVRRAADAIIKEKGATWFGVGAGLARIAQAIEDDERALLTCSMLTPECQGVRDVALSLPRVLGAAGVVKTLAV
jgi:malate/lactate dehydrogenase